MQAYEHPAYKAVRAVGPRGHTLDFWHQVRLVAAVCEKYPSINPLLAARAAYRIASPYFGEWDAKDDWVDHCKDIAVEYSNQAANYLETLPDEIARTIAIDGTDIPRRRIECVVETGWGADEIAPPPSRPVTDIEWKEICVAYRIFQRGRGQRPE